jgi:hypothetical protein
MKGLPLRVLVGALAGMLAWAVVEPFAPKAIDDPQWDTFGRILMAVVGAFVGGGVAGLNGFLIGGKTHTLRGIGLGALFGVIGASVGNGFGGMIDNLLFPSNVFNGNSLLAIPARMIGLTPVGAFLGLAIGAATLSVNRAISGLKGGAIAGCIGAALFDVTGIAVVTILAIIKQVPLGQMTEVGIVSRALYAILLGAGISLFIGLVENASKSAWLRKEIGRNEGHEWPLYGTHTILGRSETATIPLFGDSAAPRNHYQVGPRVFDPRCWWRALR